MSDINIEAILKEIHAPARKNGKTRKFTYRGLNDILQIDLMDYSSYSDSNDGYKFIFTLIDVFTKRAFAIPLKNKTMKLVTSEIRRLFTENNLKYRLIHADRG